jgi:hypothetical protein
VLINHEKQWIYTAIPKTASKSISVAFGHTKHPEPAIYHATVQDIVAAHPETYSYTSWSIVRNPFSRLVSCYFDFTLKRGNQYSETVRHDKPLLSEFKNFEDFCLRLGDSHWKDDLFFREQAAFLCVPNQRGNELCGGQLIGKYENLEEDFRRICESLRISPIPTLTHQNDGVYDKKWRSHYVSNAQVEAVRKLYDCDLRFFKYDF